MPDFCFLISLHYSMYCTSLHSRQQEGREGKKERRREGKGKVGKRRGGKGRAGKGRDGKKGKLNREGFRV